MDIERFSSMPEVTPASEPMLGVTSLNRKCAYSWITACFQSPAIIQSPEPILFLLENVSFFFGSLKLL